MKDVMKKIVEAIILFVTFTATVSIVGFIEHIIRFLIGDIALAVTGGVLMFACCLFIVCQKK